MVSQLLDSGADKFLDSTTPAGNFALRAACLIGDADCVCRLLDAGASIDLQTCRGTALSAAAAQVHCHAVSLSIIAVAFTFVPCHDQQCGILCNSGRKASAPLAIE